MTDKGEDAQVYDIEQERKVRRPDWSPIAWPAYRDGTNLLPLTASGKPKR